MATVLDFSILSSLSIIFVFIAVFIGGWGLLVMVDPMNLKDKKNVYSVLAFVLAFIVILSRPVLEVITFSIPWFSLLLLIAFFMIFFAKVFDPGLKTDKLISQATVYGFMIFFVAVILLFALANSFGQALLEEQPGVGDGDLIEGGSAPVDVFVPADQLDEPSYGTFDPETGEPVPTVRSPGQDDIGSNIVLTLFHPKILGMLFMMLLATVTILLIAR